MKIEEIIRERVQKEQRKPKVLSSEDILSHTYSNLIENNEYKS